MCQPNFRQGPPKQLKHPSSVPLHVMIAISTIAAGFMIVSLLAMYGEPQSVWIMEKLGVEVPNTSKLNKGVERYFEIIGEDQQ